MRQVRNSKQHKMEKECPLTVRLLRSIEAYNREHEIGLIRNIKRPQKMNFHATVKVSKKAKNLRVVNKH